MSPLPMSREERIAAVMAEAIARDKAKREEGEARHAKGSAGLPPRRGGMRTRSVVAKPRNR